MARSTAVVPAEQIGPIDRRGFYERLGDSSRLQTHSVNRSSGRQAHLAMPASSFRIPVYAIPTDLFPGPGFQQGRCDEKPRKTEMTDWVVTAPSIRQHSINSLFASVASSADAGRRSHTRKLLWCCRDLPWRPVSLGSGSRSRPRPDRPDTVHKGLSMTFGIRRYQRWLACQLTVGKGPPL